MEKRIELTEQEKQVIDKQLKGELNPFFLEDWEREAIDAVTKKALALMDELKAYEESGDDLIAWFWGKYQAQQAEG